MSSSSIRAKIKAGLEKAVAATGSSSSKKIYLVTTTNTGGSTPIDLPSLVEKKTILVDAIFKSYKTKEFNENIHSGDKILVSNSDVEITEGSVIRQGTTDYIIVSTDTKAPTSEVLAYISQARKT